MTDLTVRTSTATYPVIVAPGALAELSQHLHALKLNGVLWLVCDAAIADSYAQPLVAQLQAVGHTVHLYAVPSGESSKSHEQLNALYTWLIAGGVERRDTILALGGGVVGDLAGFAAASVLRGIAVIQLPTTLLAMVDSAVGGKTGINHALGKNLIGAFHQPRLVLADTDLLASLPPRELRAGWAEVIKHGVIRDAGLFTQLEALAQHYGWPNNPAQAGLWDTSNPALREQLSALIRRAVAVKVEVVSIDEREQSVRITLNYGHTIGHAIENLAGYGVLLHGETVAIGMHIEAQIAKIMGLCDQEFIDRQRALLQAFGLPTEVPPQLTAEDILALTLRDKKVQAKRVRWVLPTQIGNVQIRDDVEDSFVLEALQA